MAGEGAVGSHAGRRDRTQHKAADYGELNPPDKTDASPSPTRNPKLEIRNPAYSTFRRMRTGLGARFTWTSIRSLMSPGSLAFASNWSFQVPPTGTFST